MKYKAKGALVSILAAGLAVSAGCTSAGTQLSQAPLQEAVPTAATESQIVVKTTPAVATDEQQEQTVQEEQEADAAETDNIPLVGKSYQELYPDLKTGSVIPDEDDYEGERIKTQDDYFEIVDPSNGEDVDRGIVLPSSVDNSASEFFPEVDSQGSQGSCSCWANVYYQFTYTHNKSRNIKTTRDTTFSPSFIYHLFNQGKDSGGVALEVYAMLKRYGCVLWNMFPYDANDLTTLPTDAETYRYGLEHQLKSFQKFDDIGTEDTPITSANDSDLEAVKTALANQDVLTYSTTFRSWRADKLKASDQAGVNQGVVGQEVVLACDGSEGSHAMTLVGYDDNIWADINGNGQIDAGEMGAFKICNSHGKDYANQGFAWVAYDALNVKSCVKGVTDVPTRRRIINNIYRVEVMPESYSPRVRAEYTLNTGDRQNTGLLLRAEWSNTVVERTIHITDGRLSSDAYLSHAGNSTPSDASAVVDLTSFMDELRATNIEEVTWSVTPYSNEKTGHAMTLKAFKLYDTKTGKNFTLSAGLPCTVQQSRQTFDLHTGVHNNAIVYYRGYKDPVIQYSLGIATPTTTAEMWFLDTEKHGYVNKYVITLGSSNAATIRIGDGNGRWDDNGGQYFVVQKGDNYIVTANVGEPLKLSATTNLTDEVNDLGCSVLENLVISGGYTPYEYRVVIKDTVTGQIESGEEYQSINNPKKTDNGEYTCQLPSYMFRQGTTYQSTIYIRDSAGTEVKKSTTYVIRDDPFMFTKCCIRNEMSVYPCMQEMQFDVAFKNDSCNGGECQCAFTVMKNGKVYYQKLHQRMTGYHEFLKKSDHTFSWTPTEGGDYIAVFGRTNKDKEYVFKTIPFTVATGDVRLSSVRITPETNVFMGEKVQVAAQASGGSGTYQYRYEVTRMGKEVTSIDYSANATAALQLPFDTGSCVVSVTAKDGNGQTATYSKTLTISAQPRITDLSADKTTLYTNETITLTPETKNVAAGLTADNFVYTAVCGGQETVLTTNADKTGSWKPTAAGTYTVKLALKNGEQVLTVGSKTFTVAENPKPPANTVRVGVVYYINNQNNASQFQVHYWGPNGMVGDAACVKTSSTVKVSVGSQFWNGAAQEFYLYEATIPTGATGYKFHIGDTWFGDDGSLSTSNAVYVFEYGNEYRALYRKES